MKKRNFYPVKIANSIKNINNDLIGKIGKTEYIIYSKWAEIVGSFFFKYSEPEKITTIRKISDNDGVEAQEKILNVNVAPAAAIEFQHFENKIIEKINSFFGYKAIHRIRISQRFTSKNIVPTKNEFNEELDDFLKQKKIEIKDTTQKINDKELKESLLNLGLSIAKNEKE